MNSRSQDAARPVYVPPSGPPRGPGPSREIYSRMGEANIFRMCEDFYRLLEKTPIRPMFAADMAAESRKLASFLVQISGGPPLYNQNFGQPMMRARHLPFEIDEAARQTWLGCFKKTLEGAAVNYNFPVEHLPGFIAWLEEFSAWMVNTKRSEVRDQKSE